VYTWRDEPATAVAIFYCKTKTKLVVAGKVGGMLKSLTSVDEIHICRDETAWRSSGWHKLLHKYPGHFTVDIESFASTVKRCKYSVTRNRALTELSTLTALQILDLSNCIGLTSLPELGTLAALQTLNLSACIGLTALPCLARLMELGA
jgi:Leucine Rich repeats (2 copies)